MSETCPRLEVEMQGREKKNSPAISCDKGKNKYGRETFVVLEKKCRAAG